MNTVFKNTLLLTVLLCLLSGVQAFGDGIDVKIWSDRYYTGCSISEKYVEYTIFPENISLDTFPVVFYLFANPVFFRNCYCPDEPSGSVVAVPEYAGRLTILRDKNILFIPTDSPSGRFIAEYFSRDPLPEGQDYKKWLDSMLLYLWTRYEFDMFIATPSEGEREGYTPVLKNTAQFTCGEGISKDAKGVPIELDNPLPGMRLLERRAR